jgi:hypothetical protein
MRIRLYPEGRDTNDGRRVVNTTWRQTPLPVLLARESEEGGHYASRLVGNVADIRREGQWVTGDVIAPGIDMTGLAPEPDFRDVNTRMVDGVMVMVGARLVAVTLGTRPCWDDMVIEEATS